MGVREPITLSFEEELAVFQRFDRVVFIKEDDYRRVATRLGEGRRLLAPHGVDFVQRELSSSPSRIGFAASRYAPNVEGIRWFVREVWPRVRREGLTLQVFGSVCDVVGDLVGGGIVVRGVLPGLAAVYGGMDVAINPVRHGAGLKIKSVEALGFGLPLVTTSHGAMGLGGEAGVDYMVADDAGAFADSLNGLLSNPERVVAMGEAAYGLARRRFSPEVTFGDLLGALGCEN